MTYIRLQFIFWIKLDKNTVTLITINFFRLKKIDFNRINKSHSQVVSS